MEGLSGVPRILLKVLLLTFEYEESNFWAGYCVGCIPVTLKAFWQQ
jgi:hypothetical protein